MVIDSMIPDHVRFRLGDILNRAPVDVLAAARELGLEVFSTEMEEGISGSIVRDRRYKTPSEFVIFVNKHEAGVRQRFTAAHEIGHYVLHRSLIGEGVSDNFMLRSKKLSDRNEVEANQFAADLLMPLPLVNRLIAQGIRDVSSLAKHLQVSDVAMAIRLGHPT